MTYINTEATRYPQLFKLEKYLKGHNGFISGGCFRNIFNNEPIKDIDIFFENATQLENAIALYKSLSTYQEAYENSNAVAFMERETKIVIELIKKRFGQPCELIKNFDFTICQFVLYCEDNFLSDTYKVWFHESYFEHLHLKKLVMECIPQNPVSTFDRLFRYAKYGYIVSRELKGQIINELRNSTELEGLTESWY